MCSVSPVRAGRSRCRPPARNADSRCAVRGVSWRPPTGSRRLGGPSGATADRLVQLCGSLGPDVDPALSAAVAQCWIDSEAYRMFTLENVGRVLAGEQLGAEASLNKLFWSQLDID